MVKAHYFSTKNRVSPFVVMIGHWPDRAAMVRTVRSGTALGSREAVPAEIEILNRSTRHAAVTWSTLRDMLWTHRSQDLLHFYPGLLAAIRKHSGEIKRNLRIVEKKKKERQLLREVDALISAENSRREKAKMDKQLNLFGEAV